MTDPSAALMGQSQTIHSRADVIFELQSLMLTRDTMTARLAAIQRVIQMLDIRLEHAKDAAATRFARDQRR